MLLDDNTEKVIDLVNMFDDLKGIDKIRLAIHLLEDIGFTPIYDINNFIKLLKNVLLILDHESKNVTMTLVGQIQLLAATGQIDAQYKKINKAIEGALFILSHTSYCVRDNLNTSGTKTITPPNLIKLLLNGAKEYIENFKDEEGEEN